MRIYIKPKVVKNHSEWHSWFAWHPVIGKTYLGVKYFIWFETIQRKITRERSYGVEFPNIYKIYEYKIV